MKAFALASPLKWQQEAIHGDPAWYDRYPSARWVDSEIVTTSIRCPVNPDHQRSAGRQNLLTIFLPRGRVGDFHWTVYGEDGVRHVFSQAGVTGVDYRPVTIRLIGRSKADGADPIPPLWEPAVLGDGGRADPASGIRLLFHCRACGHVRYSSYRNGIIVDQSQWDGSDIFAVREWPNIRLCTEKVKDLVLAHQWTNIVVIPAQELRWLKGVPRPEDRKWD